ncbi:acyl-CoA dehydrogenase family member 11 [Phyllosticta capitalensis]
MAGAVRQPIDVASLEKYIDRNVPEIKTPIDVKQFGYGQSNPTYLLTAADKAKFVLRKKPPGQLLSKTAHKVDREYRIIHALEKTDVPVPKAYCLCEDDAVIGTAFYIMEFLDGRIFEDPSLPKVKPEDRTKMWHSAIVTLAKFHRVDPTSVGLASFGKHSGFYNRQLNTFATISEAQAKTVDIETKEPVGKLPHYDELVAFFKDPKTQPQDRGTFVHGDYKIDNLVFHKTEPRVIGIIDWEMSTIGHPLSDLSNLLTPFSMAGRNAGLLGRVTSNDDFLPGRTRGLPPKEELIALYQQVAGWDPTFDLPWGEAFGLYRGSIILQGIAARYAVRQASSARAKEFGAGRVYMAELAWDLVQKAKSARGRASSKL